MSQPVDTDRNLLVKTPFANIVGWLIIVFCLFLGVSWSTLGGKQLAADLVLCFVVVVLLGVGVTCVSSRVLS